MKKVTKIAEILAGILMFYFAIVLTAGWWFIGKGLVLFSQGVDPTTHFIGAIACILFAGFCTYLIIEAMKVGKNK